MCNYRTASTVRDKKALERVLEKFKESNQYSKDGPWAIGQGKEGFVLYHSESIAAECIDGVIFLMQCCTLPEREHNDLKKTIQEILFD